MSKVGGPGAPRPPSPQGPGELDKKAGGEGGAGGGGVAASGLTADKRVMAAGDVERLASQAGFVRTGKKKGRAFDVGDSSQAPIPLPEDDLDGELSADAAFEGLELAESQLLHDGARLGRTRRRQAGRGLLALWQSLVAGEAADAEGEPDEEQLAARAQQLAALPSEPQPDATALAHVAASVAEQFGVDLSRAQVGPALMATSLLVAGQRDDVATKPAAGPSAATELDGERLLDGASRILDEGRQAADDARSRATGVQRNLTLQRTFVPKR